MMSPENKKQQRARHRHLFGVPQGAAGSEVCAVRLKHGLYRGLLDLDKRLSVLLLSLLPS